MTHHDPLRPLRGPLVQAAEAAMKKAASTKLLTKPLEKAQLSHLVGVCNSAACGEEIELYLRYQAARDNAPWPRAVVDDVIDSYKRVVDGPAAAVEDRGRFVVAAWRVYAVYLARAFPYAKLVAKDPPPAVPQPAPRPAHPQTARQGGQR